MSAILPQALIRKKRDGIALEPDELRAFVAGAADGSISDYQIAAMLMAIYFQGLTDPELGVWADAMLHSGDVLDLSSIDRPKIDKHSTGGVGDKISLPLAPAVAACDVAVPMVSGRGLGHTGGTLDKLESIPGFRVDLDVEHFIAQVREIGVCLIGQTDEIAPADRRMYALRDVTATIESIPLIASSIMSKKLAEGIDGLVLDCKVGNGAFMKTQDEARKLGAAIRAIGEAGGKRITVVMTSMDTPIGNVVGNALEVSESIDVLHGAGPADTRELTVTLGAEMLLLAGVESDESAARSRLQQVLDNGMAAQVFEKLVAAQGGNAKVVESPQDVLPVAKHKAEVTASRSGKVAAIAAHDVGIGALVLGAGRTRKEDAVDPAVGVELLVRVGDSVEAGQPIAILHHNERGLDHASKLIAESFTIADDATAESSRIIEVLR